METSGYPGPRHSCSCGPRKGKVPFKVVNPDAVAFVESKLCSVALPEWLAQR